ncbi:MAG: YqjK-like family protein [Rhodocyclaceae bacterium]|nr:YqjK-like family protein [Rhodocyclaceae bacterium]
MNPRLLELAGRHGALRARIDAQRLQLACHTQPIERALANGDKLISGVDWLKQHPAAVGAGVAALVVARPKRAWRWARRGLVVWRGWSGIKKLLDKAGRP